MGDVSLSVLSSGSSVGIYGPIGLARSHRTPDVLGNGVSGGDVPSSVTGSTLPRHVPFSHDTSDSVSERLRQRTQQITPTIEDGTNSTSTNTSSFCFVKPDKWSRSTPIPSLCLDSSRLWLWWLEV